MKKAKLIIFDYDGVIVDSVKWNAKAFIESFRKLDYKIKKEDFIIGEPLETQFKHVVEKYQITPNYEEFKSNFVNWVRKNRKFIKINKGFPSLIKTLSYHYPLVVVSNNSVEKIRERLRGCKIEDCFKKIVGIEDKEKFQGLKKEERLKLVLDEFDLDGPEVTLIDDIPKHIGVAHQLGIRTIGYQYATNKHMQFPEYTFVVRSAKEIEEYFLS